MIEHKLLALIVVLAFAEIGRTAETANSVAVFNQLTALASQSSQQSALVPYPRRTASSSSLVTNVGRIGSANCANICDKIGDSQSDESETLRLRTTVKSDARRQLTCACAKPTPTIVGGLTAAASGHRSTVAVSSINVRVGNKARALELNRRIGTERLNLGGRLSCGWCCVCGEVWCWCKRCCWWITWG